MRKAAFYDIDKRPVYSLASGSTKKVVYGFDAAEENDSVLELVNVALEGISIGLVPGKFMAAFFPFLRHIPTWFPGANAHRLFRKWQDAAAELKNAPFVRVKEEMVSHRIIPGKIRDHTPVSQPVG